MITEHVVFAVIPGQEAEFELAFDIARHLIETRPGFLGLTLSRSIEHPSHYLLLVQWVHLEDHTVGFRGSPEYQEWRALLHHFYDPFPEVSHFEQVV
jgi:heme-degrading monooxygenase HmoA